MRIFCSLILILTIFQIITVHAKVPEIIENYDLQSYHPEKFGLKDLVFEVRVDNLLKRLNDKKSYGALEDIYYKVYWIYPGQYKINVYGLPVGFKQLKVGLKDLIKKELDFVVPKYLAKKTRGLRLVKETSKDRVILRAKHINSTHRVSRLEMSFTKKGKLLTYKENGAQGQSLIKMKMGVKSWSHNKWAVKEIEVERSLGQNKTRVLYNIEYLTKKGIGLPKRIEIKTVFGSSKKNKYEEKGGIDFSNYEVNTGKAKRHILKNL